MWRTLAQRMLTRGVARVRLAGVAVHVRKVLTSRSPQREREVPRARGRVHAAVAITPIVRHAALRGLR